MKMRPLFRRCSRHIARPTTRSRPGIAAMIAIVCLSFVMIVGTVLLKIGLTERIEARHLESQMQAQWLVEAGLERAAARLAQSTKYTGETWTVSPSELHRPQGGVVQIEVKTDKSAPKSHVLHVTAEWPQASPTSTAPRRKSASIAVHEQLRSLYPPPSAVAVKRGGEAPAEPDLVSDQTPLAKVAD